ncbi:MAG TPA: glycosyltransferase [Blastocatellia bacterium]|nr:glycosyltransferase [Blastocatellia bacterium]
MNSIRSEKGIAYSRLATPWQTADEPLISIIIPCYNQAQYLSEAIESSLRQDYPKVEVIVVNDGSTDNTAEVAARYPAVRCITQSNQGLSAARNAGLNDSRGSFLVFLDADDRLLPHALSTGYRMLQAHPDCAFVYGNYLCMAADGSPLPPPIFRTESDVYAGLLKRNFISMHATVMYQRAVFEAVGSFDPRCRAAEDYEMYLRIVRQFPICYHPEPVAEYRHHPESMTKRPALMLSATMEVLRRQWKYVRGNELCRQAYREGVRICQENYGVRLVNEIRANVRARREWRQTVRNLLVLLKYYPSAFFGHALRKLYCRIFRIESDFATSV